MVYFEEYVITYYLMLRIYVSESRSLKMVKFDRLCMLSYYCHYFVRKTAESAGPQNTRSGKILRAEGILHGISYRRSGSKKTRMTELTGREINLTISSAVWIQCTNLTDRRTPADSKDRAYA